MKTENLSALTIHKLSKAQYEGVVNSGNLDPNAIYLTPSEENGATIDYVDEKIGEAKEYTDEKFSAITIPVQSVNNKTGAVVLDADDVSARPNTWMPSADDVGARPNTWMPSADDVGARSNTWMPSAEDVGADKSGAAAAAKSEAKAYTDEKIALLMNNSSEAIDSIMELATAMSENENVVDALEQAIGTKAQIQIITWEDVD